MTMRRRRILLSNFTVPPQISIDPITDVLDWDAFSGFVCMGVDATALGVADFDFNVPPSSPMNYQKSPHERSKFLGVL